VQSKLVIAQSNQTWKVIIGIVLLITGSAACFIVTYMAASHSPTITQWYGLQVVGMLVGMAGFVYLCTGVRCPRCGARWIWMAVTGKLGHKSLDAILTLERCPRCGFTGSTSGINAIS